MGQIKEICADRYGSQLRFQRVALRAAQESVEQYIVGLFEEANICAIHAKRVTLMPVSPT